MRLYIGAAALIITILLFIREEGFYEYEGIGLYGIDFGYHWCN